MEVMSVMHDFIGRTMTNLHLVCYFIDSQPCVVENQCVDLYSIPFSCWCGQVPWLFSSIGTCLVYMPLHSLVLCRWKMLSPYCVDTLQRTTTPLTPSTNRNPITACCSSLLHVVSGVIMFDDVSGTRQLNGQGQIHYYSKEIPCF